MLLPQGWELPQNGEAHPVNEFALLKEPCWVICVSVSPHGFLSHLKPFPKGIYPFSSYLSVGHVAPTHSEPKNQLSAGPYGSSLYAASSHPTLSCRWRWA